jgi:hypothetical protein
MRARRGGGELGGAALPIVGIPEGFASVCAFLRGIVYKPPETVLPVNLPWGFAPGVVMLQDHGEGFIFCEVKFPHDCQHITEGFSAPVCIAIFAGD